MQLCPPFSFGNADTSINRRRVEALAREQQRRNAIYLHRTRFSTRLTTCVKNSEDRLTVPCRNCMTREGRRRISGIHVDPYRAAPAARAVLPLPSQRSGRRSRSCRPGCIWVGAFSANQLPGTKCTRLGSPSCILVRLDTGALREAATSTLLCALRPMGKLAQRELPLFFFPQWR